MKPPRGVEPTNPWGMTYLECQAMDARVQHETIEAAAAATGVSVRSMENAMARIRDRMRVGPVLAVAAWVEFRKGPPKAEEEKPRTRWQSVQHCPSCHGLGFVPKDRQ